MRESRREWILTHALFVMILPPAKNRLRKFHSEKLMSGQFVSSKALLSAATRFEEESAVLVRQASRPLMLKDPFIHPEEGLDTPRSRTPGKTKGIVPPTRGSSPIDEGGLNDTAVPDFWNRPDTQCESQRETRGISLEELEKRVDQLAAAYQGQDYRRPTRINKEVETHGVVHEENKGDPGPQEKSENLMEQMVKAFTQAQFEFYSKFDYYAPPRARPVPAWDRGIEGGRPYIPYNTYSQKRPAYGPPRQGWTRTYGGFPGEGFRGQGHLDNRPRYFQKPSPPTKKVRFSDWIKEEGENGDSSQVPQPSVVEQNIAHKHEICGANSGKGGNGVSDQESFATLGRGFQQAKFDTLPSPGSDADAGEARNGHHGKERTGEKRFLKDHERTFPLQETRRNNGNRLDTGIEPVAGCSKN